MKACSKTCTKLDVDCPVEDCRYWIDFPADLNCTLIAVDRHGRMTLRETARRLGVSFVRIKQVQDKAVTKLSKRSKRVKI